MPAAAAVSPRWQKRMIPYGVSLLSPTCRTCRVAWDMPARLGFDGSMVPRYKLLGQWTANSACSGH